MIADAALRITAKKLMFNSQLPEAHFLDHILRQNRIFTWSGMQ